MPALVPTVAVFCAGRRRPATGKHAPTFILRDTNSTAGALPAWGGPNGCAHRPRTALVQSALYTVEMAHEWEREELEVEGRGVRARRHGNDRAALRAARISVERLRGSQTSSPINHREHRDASGERDEELLIGQFLCPPPAAP